MSTFPYSGRDGTQPSVPLPFKPKPQPPPAQHPEAHLQQQGWRGDAQSWHGPSYDSRPYHPEAQPPQRQPDTTATHQAGTWKSSTYNASGSQTNSNFQDHPDSRGRGSQSALNQPHEANQSSSHPQQHERYYQQRDAGKGSDPRPYEGSSYYQQPDAGKGSHPQYEGNSYQQYHDTGKGGQRQYDGSSYQQQHYDTTMGSQRQHGNSYHQQLETGKGGQRPYEYQQHPGTTMGSQPQHEANSYHTQPDTGKGGQRQYEGSGYQQPAAGKGSSYAQHPDRGNSSHSASYQPPTTSYGKSDRQPDVQQAPATQHEPEDMLEDCSGRVPRGMSEGLDHKGVPPSAILSNAGPYKALYNELLDNYYKPYRWPDSNGPLRWPALHTPHRYQSSKYGSKDAKYPSIVDFSQTIRATLSKHAHNASGLSDMHEHNGVRGYLMNVKTLVKLMVESKNDERWLTPEWLTPNDGFTVGLVVLMTIAYDNLRDLRDDEGGVRPPAHYAMWFRHNELYIWCKARERQAWPTTTSLEYHR